MNDEELTRLAVAQLLAEGEKFKRRHELRYRLDEPARLRPNLRYFRNTLKHCVSSNDRGEKIRRSKAAEELRCLDSQVKEVEADQGKEKAPTDKQKKIEYIYVESDSDDASVSDHKNIENKGSRHTHRKYLKKNKVS